MMFSPGLAHPLGQGLIRRIGHATHTILRFIKFHNYIILLLFLDIPPTHPLGGMLDLPILDSVYPASDMKYAEYIG